MLLLGILSVASWHMVVVVLYDSLLCRVTKMAKSPARANISSLLQTKVAKTSSWRVWLGSWRSGGGSGGRTGKSGSGGLDAAVAAAAAVAHPHSPAAQQVSHSGVLLGS